MKIDITKDFEGYLWMSNSDKPIVFNNDKEDSFDSERIENPFVIEGLLYNASVGKSFNIKFVDGEYIAQEFSAAEEASDSEETFVASSKIDGVKRLKFIRRWRAVTDELCENLNVLKPAELIFVGFEK